MLFCLFIKAFLIDQTKNKQLDNARCGCSLKHNLARNMFNHPVYHFKGEKKEEKGSNVFVLFYVCLATCCSHFLTIIAGVNPHFMHELELPVCQQSRVNAVLGEAASHYTNNERMYVMTI